MDFIEILKDLMIEKDLNQVKLAKLIGIRQGQVSEWLNGKSKPGYDSLKALAIALNVSADVLLGISDV
ncbi:MAG: helix-turn-helix domain-containing protein [Clostridia bacterium]